MKAVRLRGEEIVIERPDGTRRHVLPHPEPMRNAEGVIVGAINMLIDITDRKEAERAVAHLAAIVTSSDRRDHWDRSARHRDELEWGSGTIVRVYRR